MLGWHYYTTNYSANALRKNVKAKAVTNEKQNMRAIGLKSPMIKFLISEILSSGFSFQFQYKK